MAAHGLYRAPTIAQQNCSGRCRPSRKHVFPVRGYGSEHCFAGIGNLRNGEVWKGMGAGRWKIEKTPITAALRTIKPTKYHQPLSTYAASQRRWPNVRGLDYCRSGGRGLCADRWDLAARIRIALQPLQVRAHLRSVLVAADSGPSPVLVNESSSFGGRSDSNGSAESVRDPESPGRSAPTYLSEGNCPVAIS